MTVTELIAQLAKLPGDLLVVQSSDGEGNNFSPHADLTEGRYDPESTWSGEFHTHEEDEETGEERRIPAVFRNAVVLWPVN